MAELTIGDVTFSEDQVRNWYQSRATDPNLIAEDAVVGGANAEQIAQAVNIGGGHSYSAQDVTDYVGEYMPGREFNPEGNRELRNRTAPDTVPNTSTTSAARVPTPPAATAAESREIDPATQTVSGQIQGLLDDDSLYMQRAATRGMQFANQRGLANSSMAAEATQAAMVDAALPVAQQDAETYYSQSRANQDVVNEFSLFNKDFEYGRYFREQDFQNQTALNEQQNLAAMDLQAQTDEAANFRQQQDIQLREWMTQAEMSAQDRESFADYMKGVNQQYQVKSSEIAMDPGLTEDEKIRAQADLRNEYENNVQFMVDLYDIEISWSAAGPSDEDNNDIPPVEEPGDTTRTNTATTTPDVTSRTEAQELRAQSNTWYTRLSDGTFVDTETGRELTDGPTGNLLTRAREQWDVANA